MASGCGSADSSGHYSVTTAPFTIKADRAVSNGYIDTICFQCTNGPQTISLDSFVVTLTPDPCLTSLSAPGSAPTNPTFAYDDVTTIETIGGWTLFA